MVDTLIISLLHYYFKHNYTTFIHFIHTNEMSTNKGRDENITESFVLLAYYHPIVKVFSTKCSFHVASLAEQD